MCPFAAYLRRQVGVEQEIDQLVHHFLCMYHLSASIRRRCMYGAGFKELPLRGKAWHVVVLVLKLWHLWHCGCN